MQPATQQRMYEVSMYLTHHCTGRQLDLLEEARERGVIWMGSPSGPILLSPQPAGQVVGDGSCLFHAFARAAGTGEDAALARHAPLQSPILRLCCFDCVPSTCKLSRE